MLLCAGCNRDGVKTYRLTNDSNQMSAQAAPAAPGTSPAPALPPGHPDISSVPAPVADQSASPQLTWTTPAGWTEVPPSEMRVASFKVAGTNGKQADVSVIPLAGMAGTDEANVNRWRGQVGLPPASAEELQKLAERVQAAGQSAQLFDLAGKNPGSGEPERILGVIQRRADVSWFFKMTGEADLVEQQKPGFIEFLKSLNFAATAAPATAGEMPATLPPGHPAIPGTELGSQNILVPNANTTVSGGMNPGGGEKPNWQVPAGWQEVSGGQFLVAKFMLAGENGATAAVNVSSSAGDGGGLAANVNRWRGQLGLQPVIEILTTPVQVSSGKAERVDIDGTNSQTGKPARLIGVMVSQGDRTWFYKLMGDSKVVTGQEGAFVQFVQSVKYTEGQ